MLEQVVQTLKEALSQGQRFKAEVDRLERQEQALIETIRYTREELDQRIEEMSLVRVITEAGIRCLQSETPLNLILDQICRLTEAEHGSIMVFDRNKGRLHLAASQGPNQIPPYERSYKLGEGLAQWVKQSKEQSSSKIDGMEIEALRESDSEQGSILRHPLIVDNNLAGVLSIGHHKPAAFSVDTERILFIIAGHVALLVYNAYLTTIHQQQKDLLQYGGNRQRSLVERVNDLLDLEEIGKGNLEYNKKPVRVREILARILPKYRNELRKHHIRMLVEIPKRISPIYGDPDRLAQAFRILLEDALRFTPRHGRIQLKVSVESFDTDRWPKIESRPINGKFLLISLSDTAPSMPEHLQCTVFEKRPCSEGTIGGFRDSSLSLYLAKEIIEGHIWLESQEGEGNTYLLNPPIPETQQ